MVKKIAALNITEIKNLESVAEISTFGAQAISWRIENQDIFYANPALVTDKSKALRAGAPICFPWFNKGQNWKLGKDLAPAHGAARSTDWFAIKNESSNQAGYRFTFLSQIDQPLEINVHYTLEAKSLLTEFTVKNLAEVNNRFELAFHSYFSCNAPDKAEISGLKGVGNLVFNPPIPIDQIFENQSETLTANLGNYNLEIKNSGFSKSVVWHPGLEHTISDLPKTEGLAPFICLESLSEIIDLPPSASWQGSVLYSCTLT